jgi:hypothetical protein
LREHGPGSLLPVSVVLVNLIEGAGHSDRPAGSHLSLVHFVGDCNAEGVTSPRNEW